MKTIAGVRVLGLGFSLGAVVAITSELIGSLVP